MEKVKVTNKVNTVLSVIVPEAQFRRDWPIGATYELDKAVLEQLMWNNGFRYMVEKGMLYIEDMEEKKTLGLEPEDATEPKNIIVLSDADRRKYMVSLSQKDFEEKVKKLSMEQVRALVDYAIEHKTIDFDKCEFLKEVTGRDIITAVRLGKQNKE